MKTSPTNSPIRRLLLLSTLAAVMVTLPLGVANAGGKKMQCKDESVTEVSGRVKGKSSSSMTKPGVDGSGSKAKVLTADEKRYLSVIDPLIAHKKVDGDGKLKCKDVTPNDEYDQQYCLAVKLKDKTNKKQISGLADRYDKKERRYRCISPADEATLMKAGWECIDKDDSGKTKEEIAASRTMVARGGKKKKSNAKCAAEPTENT